MTDLAVAHNLLGETEATCGNYENLDNTGGSENDERICERLQSALLQMSDACKIYNNACAELRKLFQLKPNVLYLDSLLVPLGTQSSNLLCKGNVGQDDTNRAAKKQNLMKHAEKDGATRKRKIKEQYTPVSPQRTTPIRKFDEVNGRFVFECPICSKCEKSWCKTDAHIRITHTKLKYNCDICHVTSWNVDSIRKHKCKAL